MAPLSFLSASGMPLQGNNVRPSRAPRRRTRMCAEKDDKKFGDDLWAFSRYVERLRENYEANEKFKVKGVVDPPENIEQVAAEFLHSKFEQSSDKFLLQLKAEALRHLADDLAFLINYDLPDCCSDEIIAGKLTELQRSARELGDSAEDLSAKKQEMRSMLWELRQALDPYGPSDKIRTSLEEARNGLLDMTFEDRKEAEESNPESAHRGSMLQYVLDESVAMCELRSLKVLVRELEFGVRLLYRGTSDAKKDTDTALAALRECTEKLYISKGVVRGKQELMASAERLRESLFRGEEYPLVIQRAMETLRTALYEAIDADGSAPQEQLSGGESMPLRPRIQDIPNFEKVTDLLLRGGQPSRRGIKWLSDYGVRAAVDLRGSDRANQWNDVGNWSNIKLYNIAIEDFEAPTMEQVLQFVDLMSDQNNLPLFVHCKAGVGRTGTLIACWRVSTGEVVDEALRKERLYSADGGGLRQEAFVRNFARTWELRHM